MLDERKAAVAKSLGISPTPETADALRRSIRAELRELHPDTNAGDFPTAASRDRFIELSDALADLDAANGATALVPVETVAPMVAAVLDAVTAARAAPLEALPETRRETLRAEAREEAAHRFRLSRYAAGSVAVLASALWVFPTVLAALGGQSASAVLGASIVAPLLAHPLFDAVAFGVALYAWAFFGLTWSMEQNDLARIDWVTTDQARRTLLARAVSSAAARGERGSITRADLRGALGRRLRPTLPLRLLGARDVTPSFLDGVAAQHADELVAQGVLRPAEAPSVSPRYVVAESVMQELAHDP